MSLEIGTFSNFSTQRNFRSFHDIIVYFFSPQEMYPFLRLSVSCERDKFSAVNEVLIFQTEIEMQPMYVIFLTGL